MFTTIYHKYRSEPIQLANFHPHEPMASSGTADLSVCAKAFSRPTGVSVKLWLNRSPSPNGTSPNTGELYTLPRLQTSRIYSLEHASHLTCPTGLSIPCARTKDAGSLVQMLCIDCFRCYHAVITRHPLGSSWRVYIYQVYNAEYTPLYKQAVKPVQF